jgi:catechol 2,3-dioxygenase-like lactoylglutathione lyase family enzyme
MPEMTSIHHIAITVTDLDRSVPWYQETLGLTTLMEDLHPAGDGRYVLLADPSFSVLVGLHVHPTNGGERFAEARTGLDHVGFTVADHAELEAWEARLTELGVEHSPFDDQAAYSVVVFRDPDNVQLEFIAMA